MIKLHYVNMIPENQMNRDGVQIGAAQRTGCITALRFIYSRSGGRQCLNYAKIPL